MIVDCGNVEHVSGKYVTCSMGKRVCMGGTWGACAGDRFVTTKSLSGGSFSGGLHTATLGAAGPCTGVNADPCDPYCNALVDDSTGVPLPMGGGGGGGLPVGCTGIRVSPPGSTAMSIVNPSTVPVTTVPLNQTFTAAWFPGGCSVVPFTPIWTVSRNDVSTISVAGVFQLATTFVGPITVTAAYAGVTDAATVAVSGNIYVTAGAVPGLVGKFAGQPQITGTPDPNALRILYPYNATVFPQGLQAPVLQWDDTTPTSGAGNGIRVELRYPANGSIFTYAYLEPEPNPQRYRFPQDVWRTFEALASGNDAVMGIQRVQGATPYNEVAITVHIAPARLRGTVYYNSYSTALTTLTPYNDRHGNPFGAATLGLRPGASGPSLIAGFSSGTDAGCRVCHTVSSQGNALILQGHPSNETPTHKYDLTVSPATEVPFTASNDGRFSWGALSPDGSYLYANGGIAGVGGASPNFEGAKNPSPASDLYNAPAGTTIATVNRPTNLGAAMPAFSADGKQIAFNFYSGANVAPLTQTAPLLTPTAGDKKTLSAMSFDPATKTFSNFRNLYTPAAGTAVWPSFLPNGNGVVFEREITNNGRDFGGTRGIAACDSAGTAACTSGALGELAWVTNGTGVAPVTTGGTPTTTIMANANGVGLPTLAAAPTHTAAQDAQLNFEPNVSPQLAGGYAWVIFTSRRLYGNTATINPWWSDPRFQAINAAATDSPTTKKLWVAAIDPLAAAGTDPSFPAFYLEGQELYGTNSRAFWVASQCAPPGLTPASECIDDTDCCGGGTTALCALDLPLTSPVTRHCQAIAGCVALGGACTASSQCCSNPPNTCSGAVGGICMAPAPPATTSFFTRDYQAATCPPGTSVEWEFFSWQAVIPAGGAIVFQAQTADLQSAFGPVNAAPSATPQAVSAGTAAVTTTPAGTWFQDANTVAYHLKNDPPGPSQLSKQWLRITMTFNPGGGVLPTLTNWKQVYDCIPSE